MSAVIASVSAEFRKIFSTRLWWVLAIIMVVYLGALAGGFAAIVGASSSSSDLGIPVVAPYVYSIASVIGYVFPVLLGALSVTNEFRHQSLTPTFLAQPRRGVVLGGKLIASLLVGALFGLIAIVATVGIGAPLLAAFGLETSFGDGETWAMLGRALLAMALWAAVGVGLGVLVPSQVGAIIIVLAFTQFVEPTLRGAVLFVDWAGTVGQFLPGAASDALVGTSLFTALSGPASQSLDWWQGGLVLAGYAAVFAALGALITWRRDVT